MAKLFFFVLLGFSLTATAFAQETADVQELAKLNTEVVSLYSAGKYDDALPKASSAVELARKAYGKGSAAHGRALRNLGFVQIAKGDDNEAEKALDDAWDIFRKEANPDKKALSESAAMLAALGNIKYRRNMISSESTYKAALGLWERAEGPDSANLVPSLWGLANISYWRREYDKSAEYFARLVPLLAKSPNKNAGDLTLAFYRTQCSFRKANKEDAFAPLKAAYGKAAEFEPGTDSKPKAKLINAGVVNGKALSLPKPPFPADLPRVRSNQVVEVDVLISEQGDVISACAQKSANEAYIPVSEAAAYQSKFSPTTLEGRPVKVSGRITYKFYPN